MKALHVVSSRSAADCPGELRLLAMRAPATNTVCILGSAHPDWPAQSANVETLCWRHWLDVAALWRLRRLIQCLGPDMICAWGVDALRAVRLAVPRHRATLALRDSRTYARRRPAAWDRKWLAAADIFLAANQADAERFRSLGVPSDRIRLVPHAVEVGADHAESEGTHIVCIGPLEPDYGFYQAIWTFDILQYADNETELVIVGEGSQRRRLENFARRTTCRKRISFRQPAATDAALAQASVVWVPSLADCGAAAALRAMARSRPVVSSCWPGLAEIVCDNDTGFLVTPGEPMALARRTRRLLDDPALRRQMGAAGYRRAQQQFSGDALLAAWQRAVA